MSMMIRRHKGAPDDKTVYSENAEKPVSEVKEVSEEPEQEKPKRGRPSRK